MIANIIGSIPCICITVMVVAKLYFDYKREKK